MKTRSLKGLGVFLVLVMFFPFQAVWAEELTSITLEEALELAFQQNTRHALFLREQELSEKKETLEKHPKITANTNPVRIIDGQFQGPTGSLTMTMPLGENLDLRGTVMLGLDKEGVSLKPSGSLNLDYGLFTLPEKAGGELTAEEKRQRQANSLILQTVDLLVQVRQQIDLRDYEEERLRYLEASLEAARLTPNYDDLELRRQLREQAAKLAVIQEDLVQLQLNLGTILGTASKAGYDPVLIVEDRSVALTEEQLREELFASNDTLRRARANLSRAQDELELERKTRGWDVQVSGGLHGNVSAGSQQTESVESGPWSWDVGLSATKILYPWNIILEELELAVAQAESDLETQEKALSGELRGAIQRVKASFEQVQLKAEHLGEAQDDLDFRQRQYAAGLVTKLQVQDTALTLQKAKVDYEHETMHYAQSILSLWSLCNRDLQSVVYDVIN